MATVLSPKRSQELVESQRRVRHPLQRIRGTIRTYVGLEGAALLLLFLALWFWFTFILDFGVFRAFGWDWVQEVPYTWIRAVSIGTLFLCGVCVMRFGLLNRLFGDEVRAILSIAFAVTRKRQNFPVWLRLPAVGVLAAGGAAVGPVLYRYFSNPETPIFQTVVFLSLSGLLVLGTAVGAVIIALRNRKIPEYDRGLVGWVVCIFGLLTGAVLLAWVFAGAVLTLVHELNGVRSSVSRWIRAAVTTLCCAGGAYLGYLLGRSFGTPGVIIGASFGAIIGDLFGLLNVGIVARLLRGEGYTVALTVPCVAAYLLGWLLAGVVAGLVSWLAPILVVLLMVGPVVAVVAARLMHDFSDAAIALVMERRFPRVLGDRLITAVELANPKKSARYGYSEVMIEKTIHDAAERVESVPVRDVFDWKRLGRYWGGVALVTIGLYIIAGVLFYAPFMGHAAVGTGGGFQAFHTTAGMVLERDLLLRNVTWPRRAYLEVLDWPKNESREKYVGRDETAFTIKVRAYKWVVADANTTEGWRPLTWHDLENNSEILGKPAPSGDTLFRAETRDGKKDWGQPHDSDMGWTIDEIELRLNKKEAHETLDPNTHSALREALSTLEARAADPAMHRLVRSLDQPNQVRIRYHGERDSGELTLDREANNEYVGRFPELKDSVKFTARGEDYETPTHRIKVDPPPALVELRIDEDRPAYMMYRIPGRDPMALRGLKQRLEAWSASVSGSDTTRIESLVAGSDVMLTATSDKKLREVAIEEPRGSVAPVGKGKVTLLDDYHFQVRFTDLGRFQLTDAALMALRDEVAPVIMPKLEALKEKPFNTQAELDQRLRDDLAPLVPNKEEFEHYRSQIVDRARPPSNYDFYFKFVDSQGIKGDRHIVIAPLEDASPTVEVTVNVLRQKGGVYLVTPQAFLPLEMKVKDDRGLRQVVYAATLELDNRKKEISDRGIIAAGVMQLLPGGPGQEIAAAARLARLSREKEKEKEPAPGAAQKSSIQRFPVGAFMIGKEEFLPLEEIEKHLARPRSFRGGLIRELTIEHPENDSIREVDVNDPNLPPAEQERRRGVERDRVLSAKRPYFDLSRVKDAQGGGLANEDAEGKQTPYVISLWVEALDIDIETGRIKPDDALNPADRANRGRNTATLKFKLVSENELVTEIEYQEGAEGGPYDKMDNIIKNLSGAREALAQVAKEWTEKPDADSFEAMIARTERALQILQNSEGEVRDFQAIYQRLWKECEVNQISDEKKTKKVRDIVTSLESALSGKEWDAKENKFREAKGTYPATRDAAGKLRSTIGSDVKAFSDQEAKAAKEAKGLAAAEDAVEKLEALRGRLQAVHADIPKSAGLSHWIGQLEKMDQVELARQQEVLEGIAAKLAGDIDAAKDK